jgi:hypothetical protein
VAAGLGLRAGLAFWDDALRRTANLFKWPELYPNAVAVMTDGPSGFGWPSRIEGHPGEMLPSGLAYGIGCGGSHDAQSYYGKLWIIARRLQPMLGIDSKTFKPDIAVPIARPGLQTPIPGQARPRDRQADGDEGSYDSAEPHGLIQSCSHRGGAVSATPGAPAASR